MTNHGVFFIVFIYYVTFLFYYKNSLCTMLFWLFPLRGGIFDYIKY